MSEELFRTETPRVIDAAPQQLDDHTLSGQVPSQTTLIASLLLASPPPRAAP